MKTKPKRKITRAGEAVTTITRKINRGAPEEVTQRRMIVGELPEHPARFGLEGSMTKNMGDFNSCRIGVYIEIPCGTSDREIKRAYDRVSGLVEECLDEEFQKVIGD